MSNIIVISIIGIIGLLIVLFFIFVPIGLWISSLAANVKISIFNLIGMKLRRVVPSRIVIPLIKARKAGLDLGVNQLEAHYLAGGNVDNVVNALIASERAGIELPFEKAAAIDLAGRDVLEAVKMSVNPKVIETTNVSAVAKDGIELLVKARVTVRADLERLVGGAGEATILARIGEGIVTTVGSAKSHKEVLENPDDISKRVLSKGLKSFPLISQILTWAATSAPISSPCRLKRIKILLRPRRRKDAPWLLQRNRKCVRTWWKRRRKFPKPLPMPFVKEKWA